MRGQKIGFQHTEETKAQISATMKGRRPAGFSMLRSCPTCGIEMNAPNLGRHAPVCQVKAESGLFPEKTVRQVKGIRRKLVPYGLTPQTYASLWAKQGGVCNICGGDNTRRALAVDHCHKTGAVRGLLCDDCNRLLGCAKDRIATLLRAAQYLESNGTPHPDGCDSPEYDPFKD